MKSCEDLVGILLIGLHDASLAKKRHNDLNDYYVNRIETKMERLNVLLKRLCKNIQSNAIFAVHDYDEIKIDLKN